MEGLIFGIIRYLSHKQFTLLKLKGMDLSKKYA